MLQIHTARLRCGMIATYEGTNAKSMISVEALKQVEDDVLVATVGLAPRVRVVAPAPVEEQPEGEEDELQKQEAKEKLMARLLEFGGATQLLSTRARMAQAVHKSINKPG